MVVIKMIVNDGVSYKTFAGEGFQIVTSGLCNKLGINGILVINPFVK